MSKRTKILMAHFNKAVKAPNEYIKFYMNENDPSEWYILIHNISGDNNEYKDGEYIFQMIMPEKFPHEPPSFFAKTHNGLYKYDSRCCISIGEYHKNSYKACLGVSGFAMELANGMMNWKDIGEGINLLKTTVNEKKKLAKESKEFNKIHNKDILEKINKSYEEYSKKWKSNKEEDNKK